jgi:hypothetical protein
MTTSEARGLLTGTNSVFLRAGTILLGAIVLTLAMRFDFVRYPLTAEFYDHGGVGDVWSYPVTDFGTGLSHWAMWLFVAGLVSLIGTGIGALVGTRTPRSVDVLGGVAIGAACAKFLSAMVNSDNGGDTLVMSGFATRELLPMSYVLFLLIPILMLATLITVAVPPHRDQASDVTTEVDNLGPSRAVLTTTQADAAAPEFAGPLGLLKWALMGIAYLVGGLLSFLFGFIGYVGTIVLNLVIIVGAFALNETLGIVVFLGYGAFFLVLTPIALLGGDKFMSRIMDTSPGRRNSRPTSAPVLSRVEHDRLSEIVQRVGSEAEARALIDALPTDERPSDAAIRSFFEASE